MTTFPPSHSFRALPKVIVRHSVAGMPPKPRMNTAAARRVREVAERARINSATIDLIKADTSAQLERRLNKLLKLAVTESRFTNPTAGTPRCPPSPSSPSSPSPNPPPRAPLPATHSPPKPPPALPAVAKRAAAQFGRWRYPSRRSPCSDVQERLVHVGRPRDQDQGQSLCPLPLPPSFFPHPLTLFSPSLPDRAAQISEMKGSESADTESKVRHVDYRIAHTKYGHLRTHTIRCPSESPLPP